MPPSYPLLSLDGLLALPLLRPPALVLYALYRTVAPLVADGRLSLDSVRADPVAALRAVWEARIAYSAPDAGFALKAAYAILGIRAIAWFSNRWRNGLIGAPAPIRGRADWSKELAFVTGGANGLGKETVDILAARGCNVAAVDIAEFKHPSPNVKTYKCDISSLADLQRVAGEIKKDFAHVGASDARSKRLQLGGCPTMVLNIGGVNNKSLILDLTEDKVTRMLDVNLKSHFLTALVFLPALVKRKSGHFLSVGSTMSYAGIAHQSDYAATKHALVGMHESLYYELNKFYKTPYVRNTLVVVGHMKTRLFHDFKVTHGMARFMGPQLDPADVARSIVDDALQRRESRYICLPLQSAIVPIAKVVPSFIRDYLQYSGGADGTYDSRPSKAQLGDE